MKAIIELTEEQVKGTEFKVGQKVDIELAEAQIKGSIIDILSSLLDDNLVEDNALAYNQIDKNKI